VPIVKNQLRRASLPQGGCDAALKIILRSQRGTVIAGAREIA